MCRPIALAGLLAAAVLGAAVLPHAAQSERPPGPDEVAFRIIVVGTAGEAEALLQRLWSGENFEDVARAHSTDATARDGGYVGPLTLSALRPELREAVGPLAVGQLSEVIRLPTGYALVVRSGVLAGATGVRSSVAAFSAGGSVRPNTFNVDGFNEVAQALRDYDKPDGWDQNPRLICDLRRQSLSSMKATLGRLLESPAGAAGTAFTTGERAQARVVLGQLHAYDGRLEDAIAEYREAHRMVASQAPEMRRVLEYALGVAHLHKAEIDNGLFHAPGERCLLHTTGGMPLARTDDFDAAIRYFLRLLEDRPDDLEVQWLLNAAYMATGGYPALVPPRHLIAPGRFASSDDIGRFTDVAADAGVRLVSAAGGVIVDDFDNDGVFEILSSTLDACGGLTLLRRGTDGRFADVSAKAGLQDQLGGLNVVQADYDNNGCRDVLVLRGGWEAPQRKSLLRNNCDGTFTDVTAASGLARPATSTQTAAWADIDNDGWVDLFVGNEEGPSQLFHNRRDGTFENIARTAGVARSAFTKGVAAGDYDNDGDPDFYVSNMGGGNFLYRNNGDRTFTEVSNAAGVPGADRGFPTWFFDYDNDGWEDLLVSSYFVSIDEIARTYVGRAPNAGTMKLYRNRGDGTFADVTAAVSLDRVLLPMGANFGDVDNDGFLDMYLGTGSPSYGALFPSVLLRNRDGRSFADVTVSSGTGEMHKGHGVAFADLDHDGDLEIVFEVGGSTPGDAHAFRLFENPGHGNAWLGLRLVGERSNRAAVGARIRVTVDNPGGRRTIHRTVSSGGSFGASPLQQHIGLGRDARIAELEIVWPASGTRQRFTDVPVNRLLEVREGDDGYRAVDRPGLPLRGLKAQDSGRRAGPAASPEDAGR